MCDDIGEKTEGDGPCRYRELIWRTNKLDANRTGNHAFLSHDVSDDPRMCVLIDFSGPY